MDIIKAILELQAEKKRLDQAIAALERSADNSKPKGRVWSGAARKAAAERMKKYWERRRAAAPLSPPDE